MALISGRKPSPFQIAVAAWTFVLLIFGFWIADWRYRFSYEVPAVTRQGDKGFRFNLATRACVNSAGIQGVSENHLGACGIINDLNLKRAKIENQIMIAGTITNSELKDVIFDWVTAHGMRWLTISFQDGKIWDSEFPLAEFRGVKFENVDFRGISFAGAKFIDCEFKNSRLLDSNFRGAVFLRTAFVGSVCQYCDFSGAKFDSSQIDRPFEKAIFNLETVLPFPVEQVDRFGFEFRN